MANDTKSKGAIVLDDGPYEKLPAKSKEIINSGIFAELMLAMNGEQAEQQADPAAPLPEFPVSFTVKQLALGTTKTLAPEDTMAVEYKITKDRELLAARPELVNQLAQEYPRMKEMLKKMVSHVTDTSFTDFTDGLVAIDGKQVHVAEISLKGALPGAPPAKKSAPHK